MRVIAACLRLVVSGFGENGSWLQADDVAELVKWLSLDPAAHWVPTVELLSLCEPEELKQFVGYFEILAAGDDQIPALIDAWEKWNKEGGGYIPDQFYLE